MHDTGFFAEDNERCGIDTCDRWIGIGCSKGNSWRSRDNFFFQMKYGAIRISAERQASPRTRRSDQGIEGLLEPQNPSRGRAVPRVLENGGADAAWIPVKRFGMGYQKNAEKNYFSDTYFRYIIPNFTALYYIISSMCRVICFIC